MRRLIYLLIFIMIISSCAPSYNFVKTEESNNGYTIKRGPLYMPFFTVADGEYPEDLKLAKKRFKRRKRIVEGYYKENDPELYDSSFLSVMKTLGVLLIYPLWVVTGFLKDEDDFYREVEGIEAYQKKKDQIKAYIEEDLKKEAPEK